jgi:SsrA-binding protein
MAKSPKRGGRKPASGDVATNRRAGHKFELLDRFECGIELVGTEVKALREGKAQLGDAYAVIERGEVWLRNAHIPPYAPAASANHDPERPRKLLLHRDQIERLVGRSQRRGLTLIPTRIYFKGPWAKVELALARGKQQHDRRHQIRDRDLQREMEREHRRRLR